MSQPPHHLVLLLEKALPEPGFAVALVHLSFPGIFFVFLWLNVLLLFSGSVLEEGTQKTKCVGILPNLGEVSREV